MAILNNIGIDQLIAGEWDASVATLVEALRVAQQLGDLQSELPSFVQIGRARAHEPGEFGQVLRVGDGAANVTLTSSTAFIRYLADGTLDP